MARPLDVIETPEERATRIFTEAFKQVEEEITAKHIEKQRTPIIVQLKPFFEPTALNFIFFYDHQSKADLKMLVPTLYEESNWNSLMSQLQAAGLIKDTFECPSVPVAFAKFTKLVEFNSTNPLDSKYEYLIDFYTQEEITKLTATIENYEVVNYAKKAEYQNRLLALKETGDIQALRQLQSEISY